MLKMVSIALVSFAACAPPPSPGYVSNAASARVQPIALRGRIPDDKYIDYIVAVSVDNKGRSQTKTRFRPAADGSYAVQLPRGHRYAMAYEQGGRVVGNVTFPSARGKPSQTINVTQNVVVNQQYIDLGEPTYVGGVFVAAYDPEVYMDSDGDGTFDAQDQDDDGDGMADFQDPDASEIGIVARERGRLLLEDEERSHIFEHFRWYRLGAEL